MNGNQQKQLVDALRSIINRCNTRDELDAQGVADDDNIIRWIRHDARTALIDAGASERLQNG